MSIIDMDAERAKREAPDPQYVRSDGYGRQEFTFLLSYEMGGKRWSAEIWAYDFADAEARCAAMRDSLQVDGQAFSSTPA